MYLNLIGKSPTDLDFLMFPTKRAAMLTASFTGGMNPVAIRACNRFSRFWILIDSRGGPMDPPVPMITWWGRCGWGTHAHPGYVSGTTRIAP